MSHFLKLALTGFFGTVFVLVILQALSRLDSCDQKNKNNLTWTNSPGLYFRCQDKAKSK